MEQTNCMLLTQLPRELRDRIYEEVLVATEEINIESLEHDHLTKGEEFPESELLYTCKQIRREARSLYYGLNTFLAIVFDEDSSPPIRWLQSIGPTGRKSVKQLIIRYQISPGVRRRLEEDKQRSRLGDIRSALRATLGYGHGSVSRCTQFVDQVGTLSDFDLDAIVLDTGDTDEEALLEHRKHHWKVDIGRHLERSRRQTSTPRNGGQRRKW